MAKHLEQVQWAVRPDTIPSNAAPMFDFQSIDCSKFAQEDLTRALRRLKTGRSSGCDNTQAEFWKTCLRSQTLLTWLLQFCNMIWETKQTPDDWHRAQVACLFEKGDPACPDNYRPISLLQVGYKLFSSMVLRRQNMENTIWLSLRMWHP